MFQICGDVETVGFPVQNIYKMTYGDENATNDYKNLQTQSSDSMKNVSLVRNANMMMCI